MEVKYYKTLKIDVAENLNRISKFEIVHKPMESYVKACVLVFTITKFVVMTVTTLLVL